MTMLATEVEGALLSAAASILTVWVGYRRGFFSMPRGTIEAKYPPTLLIVLAAFAIYFACGTLIPWLFGSYFIQANADIRVRIAGFTWLSLFAASTILGGLFLLFKKLPGGMQRTILLRREESDPKTDLALGLSAWLISFPIVVLVGTLLEIGIYLVFHTFDLPDQLVIYFLKMTFGQPLYLFLTILSIVFFAPLIEELLFRGFLQTYLRRYFGPSISIFISSFCFTLFHYSKDQGLGNISILGSLFVLACFLGFLYERQGSLLPNIVLHATFNTISVANLYFLGVAI